MEGEDFIFSRNSKLYYLENDYHFLAIDQNNQRPYTNKSLTLGRNASGNVVAQLDLFTNFALTDEAKQNTQIKISLLYLMVLNLRISQIT
ncbi:hypothetical protein SNF32_10165 [Enterococcus mundtii]|nr:hypothetical protein [Enterococcus mundtii]